MSRQFIECAFRAGGRTYAYHNDGEPVAVGDKVEVEARGGGKSVVTVEAILPRAPSFATKPIIGKAPVEAKTD